MMIDVTTSKSSPVPLMLGLSICYECVVRGWIFACVGTGTASCRPALRKLVTRNNWVARIKKRTSVRLSEQESAARQESRAAIKLPGFGYWRRNLSVPALVRAPRCWSRWWRNRGCIFLAWLQDGMVRATEAEKRPTHYIRSCNTCIILFNIIVTLRRQCHWVGAWDFPHLFVPGTVYTQTYTRTHTHTCTYAHTHTLTHTLIFA